MGLTAGLWLAVTLLASPVAGGAGAPRPRGAPARPTLTASFFRTERWPVTDPIEKPHNREKLRRLVQVTRDDDPDKPRFLLHLGWAETARWREHRDRAPETANRAWDDAVAAFAAAATFPSFERRDAALYWLTRLYLARAGY